MKRRWLLAGLALNVLGACSSPQRTQFDSHTSFDRTFNTVLGAMADQKMIFSVQERRQGLIVAELNGDAVKATLEPQYEGTIRVNFSAVGDRHADDKLLSRVIDSFTQRMAGQARILPSGTP